MQDSELLKAYGWEGDEGAFGELVRRYVDLVFSTALRQLAGEAGLAEEVTQSVFLVLARKARGMAGHPVLTGWLYRTTCHIASKTRRSEVRRRARELQAAQMNSNDSSRSETDHILPLLDGALASLSESDRLAVLHRYFMKRPMEEVGLALGISEGAAKMRVGRAVDRLRQYFAKRGISCSAAAVALILADRMVQAAPRALSAKVMGSIASASLVSTPGLMSVLILMSKTKAIGILVGTMAVLGLFTVVVQQVNSRHSTASRASGTASQRTPSAPPVGTNLPLGRARLAFPEVVSAEAAAAARLRAALGAPQPTRSIIWPDEEIIRLVKEFTDRHAAFDILKEAVTHPREFFPDSADAESMERLVRTRAIQSMQYLAQEIPEVSSFLWETFQAGEIGTKADAFSALRSIGWKAGDASKLVDLLPTVESSPALLRFVPQGIADALALDPQGAAAPVAALSAWLTSPDAAIQFGAACALAGMQWDKDQRIGEILGKALNPSDVTRALSSVEALARAGTKAGALVPAILDLARNTPEEYLRNEYLRAVARIQPSASSSIPEVAQVAATDNQQRQLDASLKGDNTSMEDLIAALRFPQHASVAATRLGQMGAAASQAVAPLIGSLEGKEEEERDRILGAIQAIDPKVQVEKVDSRTVTMAVMNAEISLGARGNDNNDPITKTIMEKRMFSTWWTRDEVVSFAKKLAALDTTAYNAFTEKIIEGDPSLESSFPGSGK